MSALAGYPAILLQRDDFPVPVFPMMRSFFIIFPFKFGTRTTLVFGLDNM